MKKFRNLLFIILIGLATSCSPDQEDGNPFEAYLDEFDPAYEYEMVHTFSGEGYTGYVINMVSQEWLTSDIVNETTWWHWLTVIVPDQVDHDTALLWIGGGSIDTEMPTAGSEMMVYTALSTNSIVADLHNIPFQPLQFLDDERLDERYEDDLIAYGWRQFLEGGARDEDAIWLSRLPMTKAAIRAMDTVSDFTLNELDLIVEQYVVAGGSKRGWTTWTTAIFDDRVVAIAPAVIDLLNMVTSFEHHWQAYGEWSPAIREYEDEQIMDWQYSDEYDRLRELVDPFSYLDRLTLPKYIINAASDEFFLPDSWQFYWDDLIGDKYIRYIPNTGHSLSETDATVSLATFYYHMINGLSFPLFDWEIENETIKIKMDPNQLPDQILLWSAHNSDGRDFRLYVIDRIWLAEEIEIPESGDLSINLQTPDNGFTAWFIEATYNTDTELPLKLTSGVAVTPDEYPFEPFQPDSSLGTMSIN